LTINSLLPHRLAHLCQAANARLIQISTDCVFSGRKGMYVEADEADATDLYGRTKYLGEVKGDGCITIRTSMIGWELGTHYGLIEWFMSRCGATVNGYTNAIFSGFTTLALSEILVDVISDHPTLSGLYHVSSEPISKYDLLLRLKHAYHLDVEVEPHPDFHADRSLDSTRFRKASGFIPSTWDQMIEALVADPTPYDQWRDAHAT
jgi:dTDP-4-dehydrorhamnose reductase